MWIRADTGLCDHPKVIALSQALRLDKDAVVGKLLRLWSWAAQNRENGILRAYDVETVAEIMRVRISAKKLMDALCAAPDGYQSGFIDLIDDGCYAMHDWKEYTGKSVEDKNRNAQRMRDARATNVRRTNSAQDDCNMSTQSSNDVHVCDARAPHNSNTCDECARPTYTIHNNTPYSPPLGDDLDAETGGTTSEKYPTAFGAFWTAYPRKVGKGAALRAWRRISSPASMLDAMLDALTWQCESEQWQRDGGQYIPNPATWLNQRRWEDEKPDKPEHGFGNVEVVY